MSLPPHLIELAAKWDAMRLGASRDMTPEGYGPSTQPMKTVTPELQRLKGETADEAMARMVGYHIEDGRVTLTEVPYHGWKAKVMSTLGLRTFSATKKQDVINLVYRELYPDYVVPA